MKYVMLEIDQGEGMAKRVPIIFPNFMVHKHVADRMKLYLSHIVPSNQPVTVVSAGEINMDGECHGFSESIGVKSLGDEDTQTIRLYDYLHGIVSK